MKLRYMRMLNDAADILAPFTSNKDIPVAKREEMVSDVMETIVALITEAEGSQSETEVYECLECSNTFLKGNECSNPEHEFNIFKLKLSK